jgi:hypothetical protein
MAASELQRVLVEFLNEHRPGHEPGHREHGGADDETCSCGWKGRDLSNHMAESLEYDLRTRGFDLTRRSN